MKQWHFFDTVYRTYVIVIQGTAAQFDKFIVDECGYTDDVRELNSDGSIGYCVELNADNNDRGNTAIVLWMKNGDLPCLVHELTHLVMFIFSDKGIPMHREATEVFAYYLEHWFIAATEAMRDSPRGHTQKYIKGLVKVDTVINNSDSGEKK